MSNSPKSASSCLPTASTLTRPEVRSTLYGRNRRTERRQVEPALVAKLLVAC